MASLKTADAVSSNCLYFQVYKEAEAILIPKVGELHQYVVRLYQNYAIYYEESDDFENAFDALYKRYTISRDLYGENHPLLAPCIEKLHEWEMAEIAQERGIVVPKRMMKTDE